MRAALRRARALYANASADGLPVDISHFAARPRQRRARYRALALQTSPDCQGKLVVECAHRLAGAHRSLLDKRTPRSSAHRVVKHTDVSTATRELNDNIATAALAFEASLNESELMLCRLARWKPTRTTRSTTALLYQIHRAHTCGHAS